MRQQHACCGLCSRSVPARSWSRGAGVMRRTETAEWHSVNSYSLSRSRPSGLRWPTAQRQGKGGRLNDRSASRRYCHHVGCTLRWRGHTEPCRCSGCRFAESIVIANDSAISGAWRMHIAHSHTVTWCCYCSYCSNFFSICHSPNELFENQTNIKT